MDQAHITIIGGGLVGASLALLLQAQARALGLKIVLIEPFAPGDSYQPSYDARSTALSFGSQQIYQRLGIWSAITQRAEAIELIHISDRGRLGAARLSARSESVPALGYVVENAWLGHCLWKALDPDVVQWRCPAHVTQMTPQAGGYCLTLDDGSQLHTELAVLADGGRSTLREQLGIAVRNTPYQQTALIANVTPHQPHAGQAFERFTSTGPVALLPLKDNRCALIWTLPQAQAEQLAATDERDFILQLQEAFGFRLGGFAQVGERHLYPLALVEAQEQIRPHLVVLGNAAHSLHPIAGQGYNLSLRDAACLAEVLLEGREPLGSLAQLQRYLSRQQLDQDLTVGFSDRVTRLFSNQQPLLALGRNLGLLGLDVLPPAKSWLARQAMGLGTRTL